MRTSVYNPTKTTHILSHYSGGQFEPVAGVQFEMGEWGQLTVADGDQFAWVFQVVDKWVRKLPAPVLFKLVLFSILSSERLRLRVMQDNYDDPLFQAMTAVLTGEEEVTWTGIRERLIKLKVEFCCRLYETVYDKAQQLYGSKALQGYHIKRYDSTMICHLLPSAAGHESGQHSQRQNAGEAHYGDDR